MRSRDGVYDAHLIDAFAKVTVTGASVRVRENPRFPSREPLRGSREDGGGYGWKVALPSRLRRRAHHRHRATLGAAEPVDVTR
jgi:hypothetical protein